MSIIFELLRGLFPKRRFNSEFIDRLNETTQIMSKDFAQGFVNLRRAGLASEAIAKLSLDHVEGCFDVRPLVIALHKAFLIVRVEMKHSFPNRRVILAGRAVRFERDKGLRVMVCYHLQIVARQIGFVRTHLVHREVTTCFLYESSKLRTIVSVRVCDFDARDNVSFHSAH